MADIHDLDISDVRDFLSANNRDRYNYHGFSSKSNNKNSVDDSNTYNVAFNLMKDPNSIYEDVPDSIIQWMLAYNALQKKINIPSYTKNQIEKLNSDDFNHLSKLVGLNKNNMTT